MTPERGEERASDTERGDEQAVDPGANGPPQELAHLAGMDLVRRTLEEARSAARTQGKDIGRGRRSQPRNMRAKGRRRTWSGPGPDPRDPQALGSATLDLARTRGWSTRVAEGSVFGQWTTVVGEDIAAHAAPASLRDGVLTIEAESTAWATQLRMVQAQVLAKIAAAVGDGVVTSVRIVGPAAPTWRKGKYHISGRGPRDTYG
jgi:predicted nucleic acid-binding Zn ribbon protein